MDLIALLFAGVVVVVYVVVPNLKEYVHEWRWRRMARELEKIRAEPIRPAGVSVSWARGQSELRTRLAVAPLCALRAPDDGLAGDAAPEWAGRLSAFRQELAANGQSLDDSRIDR